MKAKFKIGDTIRNVHKLCNDVGVISNISIIYDVKVPLGGGRTKSDYWKEAVCIDVQEEMTIEEICVELGRKVRVVERHSSCTKDATYNDPSKYDDILTGTLHRGMNCFTTQ